MQMVRLNILLFFCTIAVLLLSFFLHAKFMVGQQKIISPLAIHIPTPSPTPTSSPTPTPTPTPSPSPTPIPTANPQNDSVWERLAMCESHGNWAENTGNGYYGGLKFNQPAWESVGGGGRPSDASREDQIAKGKLLQQRGGRGVWPNCAKKLGLY